MIARRFVVVLASLGVLIGASGCTGLPFQKSEPTNSPVDKETTFLKVVRDEYPDLKLQSDDMLINLAKAACGALDRGATKQDIINMLKSSTTNQEVLNELSFTVGAGVPAFCPQHIGTMQA